MSTLFEFAILGILILANGLLAMAEIAIVSANQVRLKRMVEDGDPRANSALELTQSPNRFLATVQVGISLVAVLSGAYSGSAFADEAANLIQQVPVISSYSQPLGFGMVVILVTYASLLFGELVPKRIGLNSPEKIAVIVARPMQILAKLTAPIVQLLSISTNHLLQLLGVKKNTMPPITEDEIRILVAEGTHAGVFEPAEQNMVSSILQLDSHRVSELMTPRPDITWLSCSDTIDNVNHRMRSSGFSYFPVYDENPDNIVGIVSAKIIWDKEVAGEQIDLKKSALPPLFVPENTSALQMIEIFRENERRIALVIDEYGSIQGLISVTDLLQAIVGDILPLRQQETRAYQRDDGTWLVDGMMLLDDLEAMLSISELELDAKEDYQTVGGFIMAELERIPREGDVIQHHGLRFEVIDMDGNRVDKLLVSHVTHAQ